MFEGRAAIGYDHGYEAQKFYLGLALDPKYVEGFVEGCLERIGEDEPEDEALLRDLWEDEGERETVLMVLQAECEVLLGRLEDLPRYWTTEVLPASSKSPESHGGLGIYSRYPR